VAQTPRGVQALPSALLALVDVIPASAARPESSLPPSFQTALRRPPELESRVPTKQKGRPPRPALSGWVMDHPGNGASIGLYLVTFTVSLATTEPSSMIAQILMYPAPCDGNFTL
jgi:hypothetical protein